MNNEGFTSSLHVFDLLIHDIIKPRKFNCVSAEFHLPCRGEPRNLPNSPRNLSNFAAENCEPYIYIYVYIHTYIVYLHAYMHMYICMYVCLCMHVYVCMYMYVYVSVYMYVCMYVCMYMCVGELS